MAQPAIDVTTPVSTSSKASERDIELCKHVVDNIVEGLKLQEWASWTGFAANSRPRWPGNFDIITHEVERELHKTLWPRSVPELALSAVALGYVVAEACRFFMKHGHSSGDSLVCDPFYHEAIGNPEIYKRLLKEYHAWEQACHELIYEATMVVNWFADVVRRDLNPDFFRYEGLFDVRDVTFRGPVVLWVYDDETRPKDLDALKRRVAEIVAPYRALVNEHEASANEHRRSIDPE